MKFFPDGTVAEQLKQNSKDPERFPVMANPSGSLLFGKFIRQAHMALLFCDSRIFCAFSQPKETSRCGFFFHFSPDSPPALSSVTKIPPPSICFYTNLSVFAFGTFLMSQDMVYLSWKPVLGRRCLADCQIFIDMVISIKIYRYVRFYILQGTAFYGML